jgi:hypothetical protein
LSGQAQMRDQTLHTPRQVLEGAAWGGATEVQREPVEQPDPWGRGDSHLGHPLGTVWLIASEVRCLASAMLGASRHGVNPSRFRYGRTRRASDSRHPGPDSVKSQRRWCGPLPATPVGPPSLGPGTRRSRPRARRGGEGLRSVRRSRSPFAPVGQLSRRTAHSGRLPARPPPCAIMVPVTVREHSRLIGCRHRHPASALSDYI